MQSNSRLRAERSPLPLAGRLTPSRSRWQTLESESLNKIKAGSSMSSTRWIQGSAERHMELVEDFHSLATLPHFMVVAFASKANLERAACSRSAYPSQVRWLRTHRRPREAWSAAPLPPTIVR